MIKKNKESIARGNREEYHGERNRVCKYIGRNGCLADIQHCPLDCSHLFAVQIYPLDGQMDTEADK